MTQSNKRLRTQKGVDVMNDTLVVIVRAIIAFFTLLIFARVLGKQTISQLTFFDYVLGITIGSMAASLTTDLTSRAWPHWVGLFVWFLLVYILQWIVLKSRKASKYIDGEATIVIMKGEIMEEAMRSVRYRVSDLLEQLRGKQVFDLNEVEFAILEKDGHVSVLKKAEFQSITAKKLNISVKYQGLGKEIIYDGKLFEKNLNASRKDKEWLDKELNLRGYDTYEDVFLAIIDSSGHLFIDGYKDNLKNTPNMSEYEDLK